ncbi:MAG: 50S ribosomal protein L13 [Candidatus Sungbacteria bacterium RIFCSPLOWO2_02_FULL_51_17]|uniref:Large ribosomal subunit protein uL13 n=1 Tax=Candidatus Sungbacteria bacterium RIFCSPHIGHO2_02_FULL_51_29 TaxID=1802273 RepID=A0A1G2KV19_9BACT|nr:MAG: 50S ribosomal protein L13 [Candidatus Sungbacteria bacterium RIFCSPHIGHO2_01_FULL_51_22]OHA02259.1 MAG: 50S ribosomal protein L13 [Candidatus Sungbacteria bacterium RIFCSPHIGHO2_02_FULL_51_29]OHA06072.1 MAG: 50S ribosomal protein L13 [Candidatus Sungbacteria bacterium RIFCSPLOWO2_01_FULL_51_34]OHA11316.1 MAG: 50S ribosomal protein L13 [Candidatus Sungbacteria bacterium RIFCSPLOWO2_02_FULL_51_17]
MAYVVDAKAKVLGRLATDVARVLMGKNSPKFQRYIASGEQVVVYNIGQMTVTGRKMKQKLYRRHSGYIGHLKEERLEELWARDPREALKRAVWGMLPKNKLRKVRIKQLKLFVAEQK